MYGNVRNEFCYRVPIYDNFIKYDIFMNLFMFDDFNRCSEIYIYVYCVRKNFIYNNLINFQLKDCNRFVISIKTNLHRSFKSSVKKNYVCRSILYSATRVTSCRNNQRKLDIYVL